MLKTSKLLGGASIALLAAAWAAPVQAAPTTALYAGGATLPEKVYRDIMNCYGDHSSPGNDTAVGLAPVAICSGAPGTFTPYRPSIQPLYVGVGSGNGVKGFTAHNAQEYTLPTGGSPRKADAVPVPSTSDFGPFYGTGTGATWVPVTGSTVPFPKVTFSGSDDPLKASDITTYNANSDGWGAAIQVPTMISVVAVPYKPATGTWVEKGKTIAGNAYSKLNLTTNVLCGIFTGVITDWSDPEITAMNGGVQLGSGNINVKYRNDSSGTTFLFSNGLVNQCGATTHPVPATWQTAPGNTAGKGGNSWFINVVAAGLVPAGAHFAGVAGNNGMKGGITGSDGSIGYISPDFIKIKNPGGVDIDPTGPIAANLQTYLTASTAATPVFKAPTGKNGTFIMAATTSTPQLKVPSFAANCATLPQGCANNPLDWGKTNPAPLSASAYPIGGFTFIDTYTCFASATDVDALAGTTVGALGYLRWFFGTATENSSMVKNSLIANGFGLVPGTWITGAKKLLTTNKPTKIGTPGQANTGCAAVSGTGA